MEINGVYYCSRCMRRMEEEGKCPHCGYDSEKQERNPAVLEEGTLLAEKYQLGAVIGQGGFGITYAAWDENLDRPVAVKEYFPDSCVTRNIDVSDEVVCLEKYQTLFLEGRLRFERESRLLAALQEIPNVVKVLDFFSENNTAYIVMEYIHGVPLDAWMKEQRMKPAQVLQCLRPVADALVLLHKQGIVHRDLKPDNLLVEADGAIRLIDFGAAMQVAQHGETIILSRGYAPVEQYGKEYGRQGPWSDVYSLAAVIYELLTGVSPQEALLRLQRDELKSPAALGVKLHKKQSAALMAALAVQPEKRTQSMEEFRAGLYLLPLPEQVLWRKRMQRRMITAFAVILLLAAVIAANFTTGLPLGHGLLYTLRQDGWHLLREWRKESHRELPGSLLGLPVTQVERDAFREDEILEQVTLPPSVQSIGDQAFYGCPKLNTAYLNEGLQEIGLNAFDGAAEDLLIWGKRDGVQEVYAQSNHLRFVDGNEMDFEETDGGLILTRLESSAETLIIPSYVNGVPVAEIAAGIQIHKAREIYFPDYLQEIPSQICLKNDALTAIHIGKHTRRIADEAFSSCSSLAEIHWGEALREIGISAFTSCDGLSGVLLPEGVNRLDTRAFSGCVNMTSFSMPDTVETIEEYAFAACYALSDVRLSEHLTEIPEGAFRYCGIKTICLPQAIHSIGWGAFTGSGLEYIVIPAGVETIGGSVFSNCASLRWVEFLCDDLQLAEEAKAYSEFYGFPPELVVGGHKGTLAELIAQECGLPFEDIAAWSDEFRLEGNCAVLTEDVPILRVPWFNVEENCPIVRTEGVSGTHVQEITLPLFQQQVYDYEFENCMWLKKVYARGVIERIGLLSFGSCEDLEYIETTNQLKYIDTWAFEYNESLKSLDLSGVITIGQEALSGCLSLKKANLSNRLTGIDAFAFMSTGIDGLTVPGSLIVVPNSSFAASPMRWIVLEQGVKHIDTYSFANCSNLRDLVLPPGLRLISSEAVSSYFHSLEIWIYDPDAEIDPMAFYKFAPDPFPYATLEEAFAEYPPPIIHGYPGSTAEKHARECGFRFVEITETYEETVENVKRLARKRF